MNLKSVLWSVAMMFVAWWAIENPHDATQVVHNVGNFLTATVHGLSNFFASF